MGDENIMMLGQNWVACTLKTNTNVRWLFIQSMYVCVCVCVAAQELSCQWVLRMFITPSYHNCTLMSKSISWAVIFPPESNATRTSFGRLCQLYINGWVWLVVSDSHFVCIVTQTCAHPSSIPCYVPTN